MALARWLRAATRADPTTLALVALLLAAFALRVYNLDWDDGRYLHPDERHIAEVIYTRIFIDFPPDFENLLDPSASRLNPRSDDPTTGEPREFAYGALPLIVTDVVAELMTALTGTDWRTYFDRIYKIGRTLSALLDSLTVLIVFLIGRRVFSARIGLVAAAVAATAPMAIQLAHFFTTDSWVTFFVALTLLWSIRAAEDGSVRWFVAAGAGFGLAMASKGSVFTLGALIGVAGAYDLWRRYQDFEPAGSALMAGVERLAAAGLAAVGAFALFEPYALVRPDVYLDNLQLQSDIVRGAFDVPFTRQYVGTTPVIYQIEQLVRWGYGPVAGLLAVAGVGVLARRFRRRPSAGHTLLLAWLLGYGLVIALPETKFLRYLAPLLPALAIAAALAFDAGWRLVARRFRRPVAPALGAAALAGIALWTASFVSIYAGPNPRLAASEWIYTHIPPGSVISAEQWDDALPVDLAPGLSAADYQYAIVSFDMYTDRPPPEVADELYRNLEQLDYLLISSNRVSRAMPQAPWRYPVQRRFYELLLDERLGFTLAAEFRRDPGIGSWRIDDQTSDESFLNYDHPRVLVFRKEELVSRSTYDQLMAWATARPYAPTRHAEGKSLMLDRPVGTLPVVDDARWSARLTGNSLAAFGVWVLLLLVLQWAAWPLVRRVFGRFADGGWGLSRLVALVTSGYLVWIAASLELIRFRAVWAAAAVGLVAASWLLIRRSAYPPRIAAERRRTALAGEAVFWLVFGVFLLFRYLNPDSWHPRWGGEKPMEFAHLNAILRSAHFPPYDPWFSDGYINYYYYGLYLVAFSFKLTGIPSEIAFNLAQPTVIALLASAAYSVAATVGRDASRKALAIPTGAIGALLMVGIGNLVAFERLMRALPGSVTPDFDSWTWGPSRAITGAITEFPFFTGLYADLHAHVVALPITVLAIALSYALAREPRLTTLALSGGGRADGVRLLATRLALLALTLGTLSATNAWDVPVYLALTVVSLLMALRGVPSIPARLALAAGGGIAVGLLAYAMFLPFFRHYEALFGSLKQTRTRTDFGQLVSHLGGLLTIAGFGVVVALLWAGRRRSSLLDQAGPPVFVLALLLAARLVLPGWLDSDAVDATLTISLIVLVATILGLAIWSSGEGRATKGLTAAGGLLVAGAVVGDRPALAFLLAFGTAGTALWLTGDGTAPRFAGALLAAAAFVAAGTELVFLADDLEPDPVWYRMNTVFKFYNQVWVLLALAGAVLTAVMLDRARLLSLWTGLNRGAGPSRLLSGAEPVSWDSDPTAAAAVPAEPARDWSRLGLIATVLVVLASLAYPLLATRPRLEQRFVDHLGSGTLNALDWMDEGTLPSASGGPIRFAGDRAAIDWFNREVKGSPVIAEASIGPYRGNGSRISIATGLPTIIGWDRHQRQQRYPEGIDVRVAEVRTLYDSPDPAVKMEVLRRYNVAYVVVGDVERKSLLGGSIPYASAEGIAAFEQMVGSGLEVAFASGSTTVYRVLPPAG